MHIEPFVLTPSPVVIDPEPPKALTVQEFNGLRLKREKHGRKKQYDWLSVAPTLLLFKEALLILKAPLKVTFLGEYCRRDKATVALVEETGEEVDPQVAPDLAWELAGSEWLVDNNALPWSKEGIFDMQCQVFWESLWELGLHNNAPEKWDVLKWVFRPALRKYYVYSQRLGHSACVQEHERDQTFSFHNCAMAARMDPDDVRDGVRRNIPVEVYQAVIRVVSD
ncbi:MAG: hypothetical protein D4R84_02630 [Rhodocyclaceae bacterium]|nr:MAG: hypothetical protein D4R84_02630 [Rhodocyclaceae bacterium]